MWGQTYKKVTSAPTNWSGEYLIVYESSSTTGYVWSGVDANSNYKSATISSGTITKPNDAVSVTIASMTGGYSIKVNGGTNNGKYISGTSGSNTTNFNANAVANTLTFSSGVDIASNTSHFVFNSTSGTTRYRYYKSTTYSGSTYKKPQLYKKCYTVTYDANGGSGTLTDSNSPYFMGSTVTTKTNTFTRSSYDFAGWNTKDDGSGTPYAEGATFTLNANTTLYAQWAAATKVATPTFSVAEGTYNNNQSVTISCATDDATIYYTTNGDDPTSSDEEYTGAITVSKSQTIKAIAIKDGLTNSDIASAEYTLVVATPTLSIGTGTYNNVQSLTIDCTTEDATIRYTTDGTDPTSVSTAYATAIPIATSKTITVKAFKTGYTDSEQVAATYTLKVATPTFSVAEGTYNDDQSVELHCDTEEATIRYTTNGDTPNSSSTPYTSAISVTTSQTIKAKAFKDDFYDSEEVSAAYTLKCATPSISVPDGDFVSSKTVTITSSAGSTIYYTTNGVTPTTGSTEYTAPFSISATTTIKAIAVKDRWTDSEVGTEAFTKETVLTDIAELASVTINSTPVTNYVNLTNAQVTYVNGTTAYIEDASNGFYVNGPTLTLNNVYNGIFLITSNKSYNNPQITAITAIEGNITDGSAKAPTDITLSSLEENFNANLGRQLKISGVKISTGTKIGTININDLGSHSITVGKGYDLVGYPSVYNSGKRFNVVSAEKVPLDPTIDVEDQSIAYGKTFTVDDSKISGGDITVTSSNTSVATVSGLVVTSVSVGTTTITVSTAASEDYNAGSETFTLTVTAPEGKTEKPSDDKIYTFDFTKNTEWEIPTTSTSKGSYTSGDYTFDIDGDHKFENTNNYLMLYYTCDLTFPAFDKPVTKIDIVGRSGASSSTVENIYVDETAVSTEKTGSTGTNSFEIAKEYQSAGTIYTLKVTNKNAQVTGINVTTYQPVEGPKVTPNTSGYATYCCEYPLDLDKLDENVKAYIVKSVEGTNVTFLRITGTIKGGVPFILFGTNEEHTLNFAANSTTVPDGNMLVGTLAPTYITATNGDYTNFGLKGDKFVKAANGVIKANKAYLPIETLALSSARALNIVFEDETTGISEMKTMKWNDNQSVYNLNGQKVENPTKGLYIVNGKKVVIK